jgi:hypothetical protein
MILVTIDDEAGKEVPLAVYQPITLHPRKEPLSALQSRGEARVEEVAIDDLAPLRQDAHRDEGARINVTTPDQRAAMGVDIDERAWFVGPQVRRDLIAEHPWMAEQEPSLVSFVYMKRGCRLAHGTLLPCLTIGR